MKMTLTRNQLDGARMVTDNSRFGKVCNYIQLATGERYGSTVLCRLTKDLVVNEYDHLIEHGASSYASWGCRCLVCKTSKAVCIKPYKEELKTELQARIMKELNMDIYECSSCGSTTKLEADHTQASDKLMHIISFRGYLNKPELQNFISAEIKKCKILCLTCHKKNNGPDRKIGRVRNQFCTPWIVQGINGKQISPWMPTQVIPLLKKLGFKPGDKPRQLTEAEWQTYRDYADSIGKPSIGYANIEELSDNEE